VGPRCRQAPAHGKHGRHANLQALLDETVGRSRSASACISLPRTSSSCCAVRFTRASCSYPVQSLNIMSSMHHGPDLEQLSFVATTWPVCRHISSKFPVRTNIRQLKHCRLIKPCLAPCSAWLQSLETGNSRTAVPLLQRFLPHHHHEWW
jgi:hypothetical protein